MKKLIFVVALIVCSSLMAMGSPITVQIYSGVTGPLQVSDGFGSAGDGFPYTGLVSTSTVNDINFVNWAPGGVVSDSTHAWGAVLTGTFYAPTTGDYSFTMTSDDGANLYVNGGLAFSQPAAHSPETTTQIIHLNAGANPFYIHYVEWNGQPAELVLNKPANVGYTPEPSSMLLLGTGLLGGIGVLRRKFGR